MIADSYSNEVNGIDVRRTAHRLDHGGVRVDAKASGVGVSGAKVEDNKDGTYAITLTAGPPGEIRVTIRIDGVPAMAEVEEAVGAAPIVAEPPVPGVQSLVATPIVVTSSSGGITFRRLSHLPPERCARTGCCGHETMGP